MDEIIILNKVIMIVMINNYDNNFSELWII